MARVGSLGGRVLEYRGVLRHFPHFRRNALLALAGTKEAGGGGGTLFDRVHQQRREVTHAPMRAVLRPETSRHTIRSQAASFPLTQATLMVDNEDVLFPSVCKIAWEKTGTSGPATACSL